MAEVSLYNGEHTVEYDHTGKRHTYKVDGKTKTGVTTILGKVLAKGGLALWPMNMALSHLRDNFSIINMGELDFDTYLHKMCDDASKAHIVARDKGAGTGTIVHDLVEKILKDEAIDLLECSEEVINAVEGVEHWLSETMAEPLSVEQVVYSETLDYTGKFDSILKIDGKNYLVDLKTTNASRDAPKGVYPENFIQLGGYAKAYLEQRVYELGNGGETSLVHIDDLMILSAKKDGKVHTVKASDLDLSVVDCIGLWENVYHVYKYLDVISKKLKGSISVIKV